MPRKKDGSHNRVFDVTEDDIANTVARDSQSCPIANVISRTIPNAQRPSVDIATIRWTDPTKRLRYLFITPLKVQQFIVDVDRGRKDRVKPFRFALRAPVQIVPMRDRRSRDRSAERKRKPRQATTKITNKRGDITKIGGAVLPKVRDESGNVRRYRLFGARQLVE